VPREVELRAGDWERPLKRGHSGQPLTHSHRRRQLLAVHLSQLGFVVEQLELRRTPALKEVDHPLGARHEMRGLQQRSRRIPRPRTGLAGDERRIEERGESERADAQARAREEVSPRAVVFEVFQFSHDAACYSCFARRM
jgi:hypothetical protein